jgi:hypothetical protein
MDSTLLVLHVLGWVFWLGTDVGVFIACRHAEKPELSVQTRLTLLQVGMILDRMPRMAVPVVWGTGMLMAAQMGYVLVTPSVTIPFSLFWIAVTWVVVFQPQGSARYRYAVQAQNVIYLIVILGMGIGCTWLLNSGDIPLWLALKGYAYVIIGVSAILLERWFHPVAASVLQLAEKGPTVDLDRHITSELRPVYATVLCIYAGTLLAGIAGLLNPTL